MISIYCFLSGWSLNRHVYLRHCYIIPMHTSNIPKYVCDCACVSRSSGSVLSLLADPRVNLLTTGGLEISNVTHDDEGFYTCSVKHSNLSVSAELEVLSE